MVSTYGYATVALVEGIDIDYSAVDASYTDDAIESVITQAERMLNSHTQTSFTGIIPDNVIYITIDITVKLMNNRIIKDGFDIPKNRKIIKEIWDEKEYSPMLTNKQNFYAYGVKRGGLRL